MGANSLASTSLTPSLITTQIVLRLGLYFPTPVFAPTKTRKLQIPLHLPRWTDDTPPGCIYYI